MFLWLSPNVCAIMGSFALPRSNRRFYMASGETFTLNLSGDVLSFGLKLAHHELQKNVSHFFPSRHQVGRSFLDYRHWTLKDLHGFFNSPNLIIENPTLQQFLQGLYCFKNSHRSASNFNFWLYGLYMDKVYHQLLRDLTACLDDKNKNLHKAHAVEPAKNSSINSIWG